MRRTVKPTIRNNVRVPLDEQIVTSFLEASYEGPEPRTRQSMIGYLQARSPRHYKRFIKEMNWAKRELSAIGANPEDARFLA